MKIYNTQEEIEKDIVDGVLTVEGSVEFKCSFSIQASLDIKAGYIKARDIKAGYIDAWNIDAGDIDAGNIDALDIKAGDINAGDINAGNINARNISFFAVCFAYVSLKCESITGRRNKFKYFCLDSDVVFTR